MTTPKVPIIPTVNASGEILIDVLDVFYNTSDNFKLELAERLSCEDTIITHVMDQVFNGCTENGYSGSEVIDNLRVNSALQQARERIRLQGNQLLIKEIKRLREVLENRQSYQDNGWKEYHKLYDRYVRSSYEY